MAWTLEVMLFMVRSFILWESSEGLVGGGGTVSEALGATDGAVETMIGSR